MEFSIMGLLQDIQHNWTKLDPRVTDLPLISSSYQAPLIIFAYLYFVISCGPKFMKNRPPYSLKTFIKLYNISQILGNIWLIYSIIDTNLFSRKLLCPIIEYANDYTSMKIVRCLWYFVLLKIWDCIETGVFVLRKKNNQISTLHLYHHVSTFLISWITTRYYPIYPILVLCLINCFIHSIMYMYYFLAAWGPNVQKIIAPMKRWITIAQMIQLVVLSLYSLQPFMPGCFGSIYLVPSIYLGNLLINFYNFYNFYQETYKKLKKNQ